MKFFDKQKHWMFPWIKDFSDPIDHLRKMDVGKMTYKQWFWFHPSAYNLIKIGLNYCSISTFLALGIFCFFNGWEILVIVNTVFVLMFIYGAYKTTSQYKYTKNTNFYDIFMREYWKDLDELEKKGGKK